MNRALLILPAAAGMALLFTSCGGKVEANLKSEEPPPAVVEHEQDVNVIHVDHPD